MYEIVIVQNINLLRTYLYSVKFNYRFNKNDIFIRSSDDSH